MKTLLKKLSKILRRDSFQQQWTNDANHRYLIHSPNSGSGFRVIQYTPQQRICMHYSTYNLILTEIHILCYQNENPVKEAQQDFETRLILTTMDQRWKP